MLKDFKCRASNFPSAKNCLPEKTGNKIFHMYPFSLNLLFICPLLKDIEIKIQKVNLVGAIKYL